MSDKQAFPMPACDGHNFYNQPQEGMTLQDYFAAKAMQGLIHDILIEQHWEDVLMNAGLEPSEFPGFLAKLSYDAADAMLAERTRRTVEVKNGE